MKKTIVTIAACLLVVVSYAQPKLSLKEKQAIEGMDFSWSVTRMKETCGLDVKIELDQNSFAGKIDAIYFTSSRGAEVVANALASICDDKLGKQAIADLKIIKVVLKNVSKETARKYEIKNGVFSLIHAFDADGLPGYYDAGDLKKAVENSL